MPSTDNPLLGSELPTGIQSSSGRAQLVGMVLLYKLCPATVGLRADVKKQKKKCMQYFNYPKKNHIRYFNLQYSPAAFTADNIRPCAERVIPPAFLLLYHCYFPCTCLPAVALKFVELRLLNLLLDALPPLLGATTTGGLYATATGLVSCHGVHTHSFVSWWKPPVCKLSNQYAKNREISPSTGNPLMGSELTTDIQSSVYNWPCSTNCDLPLLV